MTEFAWMRGNRKYLIDLQHKLPLIHKVLVAHVYVQRVQWCMLSHPTLETCLDQRQLDFYFLEDVSQLFIILCTKAEDFDCFILFKILFPVAIL